MICIGCNNPKKLSFEIIADILFQTEEIFDSFPAVQVKIWEGFKIPKSLIPTVKGFNRVCRDLNWVQLLTFLGILTERIMKNTI